MNFEMFRQFRDNLLSSWGTLTASARVQLALTGLATTALMIFVVAWGARPEYVNLFSGLSAEDSVLIRGKLTELDVPFRVEGNGTIVQVPRNRASVLRIDMAAEGIPSSHGGVGFEIFDTTDLMTSKQVQDVNYERAIMGELQRMLNGFDFVRNSKVFITRSEPGLFTSSQEPSKAAVTLNLGGKKPSQHQIDGLLGIITSFGPANLTRETVTLAMLDGTPLNMPGTDEFGGQADSMLDANRSFEKEYKKKAEATLTAIGVTSVVSVSINRDFSRQSEYEEKFDKGQVISRDSSSTLVSSADALPQGPAGALTNLPDGDAVVPGGTQTREETESKLENMELPSTVTTTEYAVGRVKLVTASAFVEAKRVPKLDDDGNSTGEFSFEKYSDEEVESFQVAIATSIGYGMTKDDVDVTALDFALDSIAFATTGGVGVAPDSGMLGKIKPMMSRDNIQLFLQIAFAVVAFLLLRRMFRGFVQEEQPEEEEVPEVFSLDSELSVEDARTQGIAEEVDKISQEEPEAVAALLRTWLAEDEV